MAEEKAIKINKTGAKRPVTYDRKPVSAKEEAVLQLIADGHSKSGAARIAHYPISQLGHMLKRPKVEQRLVEIRKLREGEMLALQRAKLAFARVDLIETELCEMAVHGEGKKPGRLRACSLTLQRHGLIEAPGKVTAQAAAGAAAAAGNTAFEVYQSAWLRRRDEKWDEQLKAQHGLPSPPPA